MVDNDNTILSLFVARLSTYAVHLVYNKLRQLVALLFIFFLFIFDLCLSSLF